MEIPGDVLVAAWSAAREALGAWELPAWAPRALLGAPLLANPGSGLLHPIHLAALALWPADQALRGVFTLDLFLAAFGAFWAFRVLGLAPVASSAGAILYALTPPVLHARVTLASMSAAAWLPWFAGALAWTWRHRREGAAWRGSIAAALAAASALTAGGFALAPDLAIVGAVFFAFAALRSVRERGARVRLLGLAAAFLGFTFAFAAPTLLPWWRMRGLVVPPEALRPGPFPWLAQLDLLTDFVYRRDGAWLAEILPLGRLFAPPLVLLALAGAATALRRGGGPMLVAGAAAFALQAVCADRFAWAPSPWAAQAALATSAAFALDWVWRDGRRRPGLAAVLIVATLTFFSLVATALTIRARVGSPLPPTLDAMTGVGAAYVLGFLALVGTWPLPRVARAGAALAFTAGIAALSLYFWPIRPAPERSTIRATRPDATAPAPGVGGRILRVGLGRARVEPRDQVGGEGGALLRSVADLAGVGAAADLGGALLRRPDVLRAAGVSTVLVDPGSLTDALVAYLDQEGFSRAEGDPSAAIPYRIPDARTRAYWVPRAEGAADGEWTPATYERPSPGRVRVTVDAPAPGSIVVADAAAPGWVARLDGAPVPVKTAGEIFRSVQVPAGRHTLTMRYEAPGLRLGLSAALIALGLSAGIVWRTRKSRSIREDRPAS